MALPCKAPCRPPAVRVWLSALAFPATLLTACAPHTETVQRQQGSPVAREAAERQEPHQPQEARELCLRERPDLEARMVALRQAEGELARVKEETDRALPPPEPWDEALEARYRPEDREVDWQRHLQAMDAWRQKEGKRRAAWLEDHRQRLGLAQDRLDRLARELRIHRPDLFTGPGSIEFDPAVVGAIRQCGSGADAKG